MLNPTFGDNFQEMIIHKASVKEYVEFRQMKIVGVAEAFLEERATVRQRDEKWHGASGELQAV